MSQYHLYQDREECIGCHSCEVHCKDNKGLPPGPRLCRIITTTPQVVNNIPKTDFVFMPCFHCDEPWCVPACPTGAMQTRAKDGIVFVDEELCVGCKSCIEACPYGAPQWNPETGKVVKCDYCMDRVDQGLEPACVAKCVTKCLHFERTAELTEEQREEHLADVMSIEVANPPGISVCPVTKTLNDLSRALETRGRVTEPRSRQRVESLIELLEDVSRGRGGTDHLPAIDSLANKLMAEAGEEGARLVGQMVSVAIAEYQEVYESHITTHVCPTGDCDVLTPAPCQMACPAGIDVSSYVSLIGQGRDAEAVELIRKDNPFPWVCGLVCTHPCEYVCVRGRIDTPIAIRDLKAFAAERAMSERTYVNPQKAPDNGHKVCVIGAGPAGLTAAYYLVLRGYRVTVVEALPMAGGMMMVGIPRYRLPREVIDREVAMIEDLGVEFRYNTRLGKDTTIEKLRQEGYEAFFISIGAHGSYRLGVAGEDSFPQVLDAIAFLLRVALGERHKPGRRVAIIGGGNVAIDAARTCIRLGCQDVSILYRRTRSEMPASIEEVEQAEEEGVRFSFLTVPVEIVGTEGCVTGIRCLKARLEAADSSGRRRPVPVEDSDHLYEVDAVITAIGQKIDPEGLESLENLKWTKRNTLLADTVSGMTNEDGVFAGGDAVLGPATVVEAIGAGKFAAAGIDRYLRGLPQPKMPQVPVRHQRVEWLEVPAATKMILHRPEMPMLNPDRRRITFQQVELGLSEAMAREEGRRCLRCDICKRCGLCVSICRDKMGVDALQFGYLDFDQQGVTDFRIAADRCILCGACATNCPTGAIVLEDVNGERRLNFCGTILRREKLEYCESCGVELGTRRYLNFVGRRIQIMPGPFADRKLCPECARKATAELPVETGLFPASPNV
ncbi:MAG: FAD-dependent oxidoreductase [Deltaproteobacteria bacterium]|nr:FAD-dependent oxidoreductase [Deltaproteobacteria bacterium]MBW2070757.1 FAD-dependent oxidoreductase [Deltaproteobacteria bacterium]